MENRDIVNWKHLLTKKYIPFKDIKSYRVFLIGENIWGKIGVNCKECCYTGDYGFLDLYKQGIERPLDLKQERGDFTYLEKGLSPNLS